MIKKLTLTFCVLCAIFISGCQDKQVTNHYSIGCLAYSGNMQYSNWNAFEEYISTQAEYNTIISFTSNTKEENDKKAIAYFDEQVSHLDTDSLCTFIAFGDYIVYGVGYSIDEESFYILKGLTFGNGGVSEYDGQFVHSKN